MATSPNARTAETLYSTTDANHPMAALTKREYFALEAFKVLLASPNWRNDGLMQLASTAVDAAEILLGRLNDPTHGMPW